MKEERLTNSDVASFNPKYSPDGKEIAFLENRTAIRVINLKTKKVRTVMDAQYQYSYSDGDQWFEWSPDSKWILSEFIGIGGWNNKDIVLLNADGKGEMHNLTESGYSDGNANGCWVVKQWCGSVTVQAIAVMVVGALSTMLTLCSSM